MQEEIREISIKEIAKKLLYRYKIIIAMAFVGMGLMLALSVYQSRNVDKAIELTDVQKSEVEQLLVNYDKLNYYEQYDKNSLYLKVDSYNQKYLVVQYYIDSEYEYNYNEPTEPDYTSTVAELYSNYIKSSSFVDSLKEVYGVDIETIYLSELVSVGVSNNIIKISVLMNDSVDEAKLLEVIGTILKTQEQKLQEVGAHKIKLTDNMVNVVKSDAIIAANVKSKENINACKKVINTALTTLTNDQKEYLVDKLVYEEYKKDVDVVAKAANTSLKDSISVKKLAIGFLGGMVGTAVLYCIVFILSDKLQYVNDMEVTYGISVFGVFNSKKNDEVDMTGFVENIHLYCNRNGIDKLTVLSGFGSENEELSRISEALSKKGLEIKVSSYVDDNSEALKMASDSGNVLLVEMIEKSRYSMIKKQKQQMQLYDVNIIGTVVLTKY